ncbi:uncharacterized protein EI97DRAFT_126141 [Westerdykella ornata]|uniref:Uncharacterized protein n=1 Tax=Westerdykella ornata TaxID=318751 RepID=A0A6A6JDS4_WESOR|nr:uncharacterized protein EI97DRAFT_126141 [Westerdykella ornata]KAF2274323.1 hypothetical protein EI97DRAFT_126141 [Westerdykella ornata]
MGVTGPRSKSLNHYRAVFGRPVHTEIVWTLSGRRRDLSVLPHQPQICGTSGLRRHGAGACRCYATHPAAVGMSDMSGQMSLAVSLRVLCMSSRTPSVPPSVDNGLAEMSTRFGVRAEHGPIPKGRSRLTGNKRNSSVKRVREHSSCGPGADRGVMEGNACDRSNELHAPYMQGAAGCRIGNYAFHGVTQSCSLYTPVRTLDFDATEVCKLLIGCQLSPTSVQRSSSISSQLQGSKEL